MSAAPTPHVPVTTTTSFPLRSSATPTPPEPPKQGLPLPSTFDILPDLYRILNRVLNTSPVPPAPTTPGQQHADGPLEIDQVAAATSEVKLKLQKAQKAVMALPDIDRTCEDQQEEIEYLETRIERLKASLQRLGQGPQVEVVDTQMTG